MHPDSLLVSALYYLLAAVIAVPLSKKIGLGSILGYLCAGVVLGPHVLAIIDAPEGVWWLFSLTIQQSTILGLTLGLSSTAFAIQLMNEEHILASPLGRKGFGILLLQDLAVIPILILVGVFAQASAVSHESVAWYYGIAAVVLVLLMGRFALNPILGIVAATNNREIMTAASLLIVISVAALMEAVGLSMGLGAFLAGILLLLRSL